MEFDVIQHRGRESFKIVGLDRIVQTLDENTVIVNGIISSQYVKRHQHEVEDLIDKFNLIFDCIEQWKECQRNWLYLESIFSSS